MMSKFEVYQDAAGEWRWRLIAKNGRKIADSAEGYKERRKCTSAIAVICRAIQDMVGDRDHIMIDVQSD